VASVGRCLSLAAWRVDSVGLVIATLAVENYRSLRSLIVPLAPLTVVTGANGTGKSSLYRALRLLADAARNGAVAALAREGGPPSTLWAGPETIGRAVRDGTYPVQGVVRARSVSLRLGFGGDDFSYAIDFGLPVSSGESAFKLDPEIKRESIWNGPGRPRPIAPHAPGTMALSACRRCTLVIGSFRLPLGPRAELQAHRLCITT